MKRILQLFALLLAFSIYDCSGAPVKSDSLERFRKDYVLTNSAKMKDAVVSVFSMKSEDYNENLMSIKVGMGLLFAYEKQTNATGFIGVRLKILDSGKWMEVVMNKTNFTDLLSEKLDWNNLGDFTILSASDERNQQ